MEYRVLHFMLKNMMSLFIESISLYNTINFSAILYPKSPANLVVEVGTRHSHQILLVDLCPMIILHDIPSCIITPLTERVTTA